MCRRHILKSVLLFKERQIRATALALASVILAARSRGQVVTEYPIPTGGSEPFGIAAGPDGDLWFTEYGGTGNQIGRITTDGVVVEFPLATVTSSPVSIAVGSDGNLWFTEQTAGQIGRITTEGAITEFPILTSGGGPYGIAAGPDGSLWFTEYNSSKIGRITTAGVVTEFPIPTSNSFPFAITAGPDGNLWFTEFLGNQIGRITTAGVITEFPLPTVNGLPYGITPGPDGNLWFGEDLGNQIGRITTAGVITEFPVLTFDSHPRYIASGPDGNLWFTEFLGNQVGRITTAGVITEFPTPTADSNPMGIARGPDGNLWFTEQAANQIGKTTVGPTTPLPMAVDAHSASGSSSNTNGVLEPGETVLVAPSWRNTLDLSQAFTGTASNLSGPPGPTYSIEDGSADYGTINADAIADCDSATGDCYVLSVSGTRPAAHWDATFMEGLSSGSIIKSRTLHVGGSFADVPASQQFYKFIENLFHNGVTSGYTGGNYCPENPVSRAQMAVFLMKSNLGAAETPPAATGTTFADVPASNPFAPWIEQLAGFQITGGCGGGNYCPDSAVTRAQMAVFLLKAEHGSAYTPPLCAGIFPDVPCSNPFADWIEQLFAEGITGGCGGGNYCPDNPNTRGQTAVFLVKTFGLQLYGGD
jgi:streptogramin lyase